MNKTILLTSFDIWQADQRSNSSDDLLKEVKEVDLFPHALTFLRRLPVDVELASFKVIEKIQEVVPDGIICCGMAQSREKLSVEKCARCGENVLETAVDLERLVAQTVVDISYDCGKFVCEGLYYSVLDYLRQHQVIARCIFVHVPIVTKENSAVIVTDFLLIIQRLALG